MSVSNGDIKNEVYPLYLGSDTIYAHRHSHIISPENSKCVLFFFIGTAIVVGSLAGIIYGVNYAIDVDFYNMTADTIVVCGNGFIGCFFLSVGIVFFVFVAACVGMCVYEGCAYKRRQMAYNSSGMIINQV